MLQTQFSIQLSKISNTDLWLKTKSLVLEETSKTLEVLHHLREIEKRKLYLSHGFSSLFDYAVKELKYSHSAAYRRIEAMRLIKEVPEVESKILKGSLNLTTASQVRGYLKQACKTGNQNISASFDFTESSNKLKLIEKLENKSSRDVEKELIALNPESIPKEKVRPLDENTFEIKIVIDHRLKAKLDQLKSLMSHKHPHMSYEELLEELADKALAKLDLRQHTALPAPEVVYKPIISKKTSSSRYIPINIKRFVWQRDQGRCQFQGIKHKCNSTHFIQIDHIKPYSLNGSSTDPQNLRLLCGQHNRWRHSQEA